jgi:hypothetical protein
MPSHVTTRSMRYFARVSLKSIARADDASRRQLIKNAARSWLKTADAIDRYVAEHRGEVFPGLRSKLN